MTRRAVILRAFLALLLPAVVFLAGAGFMLWVSGHAVVSRQLALLPDEPDRLSLNQRVRGYDHEAVRRHWEIFTPELSGAETAWQARHSEKMILYLDLAFPLFYGASFLLAYGLLWTPLGRPFSARWMILPVAITVGSDWTENLIHLQQLHRHAVLGAEALQPGWIQLASLATTLKLTFFMVSGLLGLVLCGWFILRSARARSAA
jgi:hypothetical protein